MPTAISVSTDTGFGIASENASRICIKENKFCKTACNGFSWIITEHDAQKGLGLKITTSLAIYE